MNQEKINAVVGHVQYGLNAATVILLILKIGGWLSWPWWAIFVPMFSILGILLAVVAVVFASVGCLQVICGAIMGIVRIIRGK